jgi:DNA-binding response OmpR family regulator
MTEPLRLLPGTAVATTGAAVLLVEDEPTIAVTLTDDLVDSGYRVTRTDDGRHAIRLLTEQSFAAVITDLRLPGADGVAVLRAATRHLPGVRVLVISAWLEERRDEVLRAGATALLAKPFCNSAVVAWLRRALDPAC